MTVWREHPWAKGREADLEPLTDEQRAAWFARREEDDRVYVEWRRSMEPTYEHPWPVGDH